MIDLLDTNYPPGNLPMEYQQRYVDYPDLLVDVAKRNASTHLEILERFSAILEGVDIGIFSMESYVSRLKLFVEIALTNDPSIIPEIGKLLRIINDFKYWHQTEHHKEKTKVEDILKEINNMLFDSIP